LKTDVEATMKKVLIILAFTASVTWAQTYQVDWYVVGSGGGHSQTAAHQVDGTISQPLTGKSFTTNYMIEGGFWVGVAGQRCEYIPGNSNGVAPFNGIDVTYSVNYLKGLGPAPPDTCDCRDHGPIHSAADANGDCSFNGIDVTFSINFLKGFGDAPHGCTDCPPRD
jgi:hypothetical protein